MTIDVRDLSFRYTGRTRPAVAGMTFRVDRGEVLGFLGPSGAGKSTTQNILVGLLRGFRGDVTVLGRRLSSWGADYYQHIGVSFELPNHYRKLTARENLRFFASLYERATADPVDALERVGLAADADTRVGQFSKGMQVRLNLARALLHRPEVLFLDEPTAGLDPASARLVKDIVREQRAAGRTVFLTTHDMTVAEQLCDRVAFVVDGRIALVDVPAELKLRRGRRRVRVGYRTGPRVEYREFPLDGLADDSAFAALLRDARVETIHTQEATLEDVFMAVTGRGLA